jgi:hypothetical protein
VVEKGLGSSTAPEVGKETEANGGHTTREVLIKDATLSSLKTLKSSPRIFCDELVTKWVSSWNERHWLSTVTKRLFSS